MDTHLTFTLPQLLSFIGLCQAVFVLTYIAFRARHASDILLPGGYFALLAIAFLLDFAAPYWSGLDILPLLQWTFWLTGPPLSVMLILQVANGDRIFTWYRVAGPLCIIGAAIGMAVLAVHPATCETKSCAPSLQWFVLAGVAVGLLSFLGLWPQRAAIRRCKAQSHERYWLVVTLIAVNLWLLAMVLMLGLNGDTAATLLVIRPVIGITLIYIATTSLLRIYPQVIDLKTAPARSDAPTPRDIETTGRLRDLIDTQKIYQEPDCSRSMIARELSVSESVVSRIVGNAYGCTVPRMISEKRVHEAKTLLRQTGAMTKIVAAEAGFASPASFNRVFREIEGMSPSAYRASCKNERQA